MATARTFPNCIACSATLASRLCGGALLRGVGNSDSAFAFFADWLPIDAVFESGPDVFRAFRPAPPVSKTSRRTSCRTLSGGTRGGSATPNPSDSS